MCFKRKKIHSKALLLKENYNFPKINIRTHSSVSLKAYLDTVSKLLLGHLRRSGKCHDNFQVILNEN